MNKDKNIAINEEELILLEGILNRNYSYAQQLDTYASILIALSSAVFIFAFTELRQEQSLFWVVLGLTAGLATILSLIIVRPPRSLRKRGQEESIMYSRKITSYATPAEYTRELRATLDSREEIIAQYGKEIFNLTKYYYLPKKLVFRAAKGVLLLGMTTSLIIFISEYLS